MDSLIDVPDFFIEEAESVDPSIFIADLRSALTTSASNDIQPNLWFNDGINCSLGDGSIVTYSLLPVSPSCFASRGGSTWSDLTESAEPFVAQLAANFNTGLIRQFLPRLNSSVSFEPVDVREFPTRCDQLPGAFYVEYNGTVDSWVTYSLQACMPSNQTHSTWAPTRRRQDLTETLYLNISVDMDQFQNTTVFKVQANSTAGYFELPNYLKTITGRAHSWIKIRMSSVTYTACINDLKMKSTRKLRSISS